VRGSDAVTKTLTVSHAVDMAYLGQIHAMRVLVEADWPVARMVQAFNEAFGRVPAIPLGGIPVMIINVRTTVEACAPALSRNRMAWRAPQAETAQCAGKIYFAEWRDTPIYRAPTFAPA